jgi:hypothetical protein
LPIFCIAHLLPKAFSNLAIAAWLPVDAGLT